LYLWGGEKCIHGFGGKTRGMRPRGRPKLTYEYNIKRYLRKLGEEGVKVFHLAQIRASFGLLQTL
jgi:hypothetical protein